MNIINMLLGERRRVYMDVTSSENANFTIASAKYSLYEQDSSVIQVEGSATIAGRSVNVIIEPQKKKPYILEFTLEIADEIVKKKITVNVL